METLLEVSRRERKRQAIHHNILSAGGQLFRERGVSGTTVDDIVEEVDVARQTFFNHFPYKEALALELVAEEMRRVERRAQGMLDAGCPPLEVLRRVAELILDLAIGQREVAVAVAHELQHSDSARARRAAVSVPLRDLFGAILIQARDEGAVRDSLPLNVVAELMCDFVTRLMTRVTAMTPADLQKELAVCFDMVFNGVTDRSR